MKSYYILLFYSLLTVSATGQPFHQVSKISDPPLFNTQLQFTASLLNEKRSQVRVLIYGQSISAQDWWLNVKTYFEKEYPKTTFLFANKAIGGFSSERLKLTTENDIVSFYPDLILFHDYGNHDDYEKIIRIIQNKTTADIAIQTDHMADQNQDWHDQHSNVWLPDLCKKYGLALIDIRKWWKNYLLENNLQIKDLLVDGVHLNDHGNYLMTEIIKAHFDNLKYHGSTQGRITKLKKNIDFVIEEGTVTVPVTGNRLDVKTYHNKMADSIKIFIDGTSLNNMAKGFYYTRPTSKSSGEFLTKMGSLIAMKLTGLMNEEEWRLTILSVDSIAQEIKFSLSGSKTGFDGTGISSKSFVSDSGRISIHPEAWFIRRHEGDFAQYGWIKTGEIFFWQTKRIGTESNFNSNSIYRTLFQGIDNTNHTITITGPGIKYIEEMVIYSPPGKTVN